MGLSYACPIRHCSLSTLFWIITFRPATCNGVPLFIQAIRCVQSFSAISICFCHLPLLSRRGECLKHVASYDLRSWRNNHPGPAGKGMEAGKKISHVLPALVHFPDALLVQHDQHHLTLLAAHFAGTINNLETRPGN